VHLIDLLARRAEPAAGLYLSVTRRCPLHCAHCSTRSTMSSEQLEAEPLRRLVASFRSGDRPDVVYLTGGEPLLRPRLVTELATAAAAAGSSTALLSGMWFVGRAVPAAVAQALHSVGHVSASIDRFHEHEVPRAAVLDVLAELAGEGRDVSVHLTGESEHDPYLADAISEIRERLDDRCPIYVALVQPVGRAGEWLDADGGHGSPQAVPCRLASWPVVAFDGTVVACCSQLAVDGPVPEHLRLGHAGVDGWPAIRRRAQGSAMLGAIRTFGPRWLAANDGGRDCGGYCETCMRLSDQPGVAGRVEQRMARPEMQLPVRHAERARPAAREWIGLPRFEHLLELGRAVPA